MALVNFPDQIKVKLGSNFSGGGYGLDQGDEIVLTRLGPGSAFWVENPAESLTPSATNRMSLNIQTPFGFFVQLADTGGAGFTTAIGVYYSAQSTYTFLDWWNSVLNFSPSTRWQIKTSGQLYGSWARTSPSGTYYGRYFSWWKTNTFETFEEDVPSRQDKTTYPFG